MTDAQRARLLATARRHLARTTQGHVQYARSGKGSEWKASLDALDQLAADLAPGPVPQLGPVIPNGHPVLVQDLTHATGGVPHYPAFDDGFGHPGLRVIAPEPLTVTRTGRFVRRDGRPDGSSVYATGRSKLAWVFGHLESIPAVGATLRRGQTLGTISPNHELPHVHVGIDARPLIGRELAHHLDYTHGAPTIGMQLRAALP